MAEQTNNLKYYFFYVAASVVILAGFKAASSVVVILFLAIFIASILSTFLTYLQSFKIPKLISYIIVVSISVSFFILLFYMINKSLASFSVNLPVYQEKIKHLISSLVDMLGDDFEINKKEILKVIDVNYIVGFSTKIIGSVGTLFSKLLLVFIGVAFILSESTSFAQKLKTIFKEHQDKLESFKLFSSNLQKYFLVKTFTSSLTGLFVYVLLLILDIEYPILWAMMAFLFNFIPVIGSILAAIPAILLSLISNEINTSLALISFYVIINISVSNILEPKLMGKKLGLSAMVIFFALIFFGWVLGIAGMFLAVPLTMTLKIAFDSSSGTKWIGVLLSQSSTGYKSLENEVK